MSLADQECQRYYQPWLSAHGSSDTVAQHLASVASLGYSQKVFEPFPSRDPILIAFAQNVCFRLNVRRCMISLLDSANQYVLGEATRSYSSRCPNGNEDDAIWMGAAILARPEAMCEHSLSGRCQAIGRRYSTDGMIVNDARCDRRFENRPYVLQEGGSRVRFYAGVPLVSRSGQKIGVLAATDERPRVGLSWEELGYMEDMARCAMEHLEWARDRVDRFKGDRIVRGMASFIEEAEAMQVDGLARSPSRDPSARDASPGAQIEKDPPSNERSVKYSPIGGSARDRSPKRPPTAPEETDLFEKASSYLRNSTLADGCVIFGATTDSYDQPPHAKSKHGAGGRSPGLESTDGSLGARPCKILSLNTAHSSVKTSFGCDSQMPFTLDALHEYFESYPQSVALYFSEDGDLVSSPEEKSGNADLDGLNIGAGCTAPAMDRTGSSHHRMNHRDLLQQLPGARTLIFLPLWDPHEDKLVAGVFLWSLAPGRLAGTDLLHIRAFADCVVSQIVRMDIQRDEAAKTTFIASMSHELRSPLHGILGAAEFLVESTTNAYETGLVMSIITCGRTLLDTLSHVMDYSKINNSRAARTRPATKHTRQSIGSPGMRDGTDTTPTIDLGALLEDVAESVAAGHTFQHSSSMHRAFPKLDAHATVPPLNASSQPPNGPGSEDMQGVTVLLDVTPRVCWMVKAEPGALQRIIMNLFGNALKYTSSGFVALSLRALKTTIDDKISVLLRVADSGKGISEMFQRNKLFRPFSQEDSFQPGSGLGLSIVKQIVESIGGTIEVNSTPGKGTTFDVYLQLTPAESTATERSGSEARDASLPDQILGVHKHPLLMTPKLVGRRLVLLDSLDPDRIRSPTHQAARFQHTLRDTCEKWFGMHVSRATSIGEDDDVSIYLYGEPPPIEMLRYHKQVKGRQPVPVILACQNDHDARAVVRDRQAFLRQLGEIVEVIQQPCGPRKLAKTFLYCLARAEESAGRKSGEEVVEEVVKAPPDSATTTSSVESRPVVLRANAGIRQVRQELRKDVSAALALPTPPVLDPATPSWDNCGTGDISLDLLASPDQKSEPNGESLHCQPPPPPTPARGPGDQKPPQQTPAPPKPTHLLIVDDNKINRQLLIMFIKKCGFTYQEAENGQEAVDLFSPTCNEDASSLPHKFDHILMDISMPVMDGLEATRRIRALEQAAGVQRTRILALTALASEKARTEAETAGVDLFMSKPVKFAELKGMLV